MNVPALESKITHEAHQTCCKIELSFTVFQKSPPLDIACYILHFQYLRQYIDLEPFKFNRVHT